VTEKVYEVPFVRDATVQLVAVVVVQDATPGEAVTVYPVMGDPPLNVGAVQLTTEDSFAIVAETDAGALGLVAGITGSDVAPGPEPSAVVATTVKV
jgi:hypothetical protein